MKVWALTQLGKRLARSPFNPNNPNNVVLHGLDKLGNATADRLAEFTGLESGQVSMCLNRLRINKLADLV